MLTLRLATIAVWLIVAIYMAPAVWSLVRGKGRQGDPARLVCFSYAFIMIAGTARWLLAPSNDDLWSAVYMLCVASGIYTLFAARSYGRGPHV